MVCKLVKSLYALKQTPRQWYRKFDDFMGTSGFTRCQSNHCCSMKSFGSDFIILLLYVDDMFIAGSIIQDASNLKNQLSEHFAMKGLVKLNKSLGLGLAGTGKKIY